jgi:hypothetical protein
MAEGRTWRDQININTVIAAAGFLLTISLIVWRGGRIEEKVSTHDRQIIELRAEVRAQATFVNDALIKEAEYRGEFRGKLEQIQEEQRRRNGR